MRKKHPWTWKRSPNDIKLTTKKLCFMFAHIFARDYVSQKKKIGYFRFVSQTKSLIMSM